MSHTSLKKYARQALGRNLVENFRRLRKPSLSALCLFVLVSLFNTSAAQTPNTEIEAVSKPEPLPAGFDEESFSQTFTHHTAIVNGVRLHYVTGGHGDAVVLLHGRPTSWYEWRPVMPLLAHHYTLIVPDLRGLGDSDKPESGYDKRTLASDIYRLCRQMGYTKIDLVGHDWGSSTAFALAHEHPEFVRRVVFTDNVIPGLNAGSRT